MLHKAQYDSLFNEQKVIRNQLLFRLQSMIYQRLIYLLIPTINKKTHCRSARRVFSVLNIIFLLHQQSFLDASLGRE